MKSIALCDDHKLVTDSLTDFIHNNTDYKVVFTANSGKNLLSQLTNKSADLILLDISMPDMDGLEALSIIRKRWPKQKVLVLSMFNDEALLLRLLSLRINGYLSKGGPVTELLKAIKEINEKGHYYSDQLIEVMYKKSSNISKQSSDRLDEVELDEVDVAILKYICQEKTSKEMSEQLFLSPRTIEGRRKRLLKVLQLKNQAGLALYAIKRGLYKI